MTAGGLTTKLMLADYQERFVENLRGFIAVNWLRRRPKIRILDSGCDTSGHQLRRIAALTRGEVVGINPAPGFPSAESIAAAGDRVTLVGMDGMNLRFPDEFFDLVVSANVMEHVPDPAAYLRECARVLKPHGRAWIETSPVWTGPRGHHIHEDMVASNCPNETTYRNNGTVIPDWAHLTHTPSEMEIILRQKLQQDTVAYIMHYLHGTRDLNKTGWRAMRAAFENAFPWQKIAAWDLPEADPGLMPKDGADDYKIIGFAAQLRKRAPQRLAYGISRRLIWRLRRMGI